MKKQWRDKLWGAPKNRNKFFCHLFEYKGLFEALIKYKDNYIQQKLYMTICTSTFEYVFRETLKLIELGVHTVGV